MSARSSSSVSNSLTARASSSSSCGSTCSLISLSVASTLLRRLVGELVRDLPSRRRTCRGGRPRSPRRSRWRRARRRSRAAPRRRGRGRRRACRPARRPALDGRELGDRSRSSSSSWSTISCGTSASANGTSSFVQSATSGFGWTATVAVKRKSRRPTRAGRTRTPAARSGERGYGPRRCGTSRRCGCRPPRCRAAPCRRAPASTFIGTLPLRKPGILRLVARSSAAWSIACCTSPLGTSTSRRTRFSGSSSTIVCTRPI